MQVNSAVIAVKSASSDNNITALDAEPSSSWLPESGSNEEVTRSAANVEAVTLMLTVQPGIASTESTVIKDHVMSSFCYFHSHTVVLS